MNALDEYRVLTATPTGRDAELIARLLNARGINTEGFMDVPALLCEAGRSVGAMVLADEALNRSVTGKIELFRESQPAWSDVPIVVLTRAHSGSDMWAESLHGLGQVSVIERPVGRGPLLSAVEAALRARKRQYDAREQFQELERISDELRAASSLKDELLGLVSHELRTPLTGILGCASILKRRLGQLDPDDRDQLLEDIEDHAIRLQRIIENMLALSRAETAAETITEPVLLQRTLPAALQQLEPLRGGRALIVTVQSDLPPVDANAVFVEQAVSNLVRNSEKYAEPGQPVEVRMEAGEDKVLITVMDRGAQLTQPQVDNMFEAFFRAPEHSLRVAGLGLGLPVCKRLTEAQGGTITARPRTGGGLQVTLAFPVTGD